MQRRDSIYSAGTELKKVHGRRGEQEAYRQPSREQQQESLTSPEGAEIPRIYTLGSFSIRLGEGQWIEMPQRVSRSWNLFQYLLSHRGKRIQQEELIDIFWPEEEGCSDPRHALRTMIYRLRSQLNGKGKQEEAHLLSTSQGSYMFNPSACWLDAENFEKLACRGQAYQESCPQWAKECYRQALQLYQGEYLPENQEEWVIPLRAYYRNLYLTCTLGLAQLLKLEGSYREIIDICREAVPRVPLEEELHYYFLEALIREGNLQEAREHYHFVEVNLQQKLGEAPSAELKELYRQTEVKTQEEEKDLHFIRRKLDQEDDGEGAFFCSPEAFRLIYQLELNRQERTDSPGVLCMAYIKESASLAQPGLPEQNQVKLLKEVLTSSLRKADVLCRWNQTQFLVLLHGTDTEGARKVTQRVKERYRQLRRDSGLPLYFKVLSLVPWNGSHQ